MSAKLIHCIYASAAVHAFNQAELMAVLEKSRTHNERHGITGVLLHAEGSFFQVIEGPEPAVDALFERIVQDPRHEQVTLVVREPIARRGFGDWSMGLFNLPQQELAGIAGLNEFFSTDRYLTNIDSSRAWKLLNSFRDGRWHKKAAPSCEGVAA